MLAEEGSFEQDFCSLFETAFAKRPTIDSVDAMTRDGGENTALSHHVNQGAQMPIVDIDVISAENHTQLLHKTIPSSLYTKHLQNFNDMVASRSCCIDSLNRENALQVHSVRLNEPTLHNLDCFARFCIVFEPITVFGTLCVEYLGDLVETSKSDLVQDLIGQLSQDHDTLLAILFVDVVGSDSDNLSARASIVGVKDLQDGILRIFAIECLIDPFDYIS